MQLHCQASNIASTVASTRLNAADKGHKFPRSSGHPGSPSPRYSVRRPNDWGILHIASAVRNVSTGWPQRNVIDVFDSFKDTISWIPLGRPPRRTSDCIHNEQEDVMRK